MIALRKRSRKAILVDEDYGDEADIVDIGAERVLLPGALESKHIAGTSSHDTDRDQLPDTGGHAGRVDGSHHRSVPQHVQTAAVGITFAGSWRIVERQFIGLTGMGAGDHLLNDRVGVAESLK